MLDEGPLLDDPIAYRALVGKLNFLTNTRPDLSFSVQTLSQFLQALRVSHLQALLHTLAYIAGSLTKGIFSYKGLIILLCRLFLILIGQLVHLPDDLLLATY